MERHCSRCGQRQMTETELKLYAHPAIQGRRGEWQVGDRVWGGLVVKVSDDSISILLDDGTEYEPFIANANRELVWLPLSIAPVNPEHKRDLWGMVDWSRYDMGVLYNGRVVWHCEEVSVTEALLRAVIAQEETK